MTVLQVIPIVVSALALLLSLYTYFRHDAKIKTQNALINSFQLDRFRKETDSEKKAIIEAYTIKGDKGKRTIKVYNKGKATAKNVVVTFPGNHNVIISKYPDTIDIDLKIRWKFMLTFMQVPLTRWILILNGKTVSS